MTIYVITLRNNKEIEKRVQPAHQFAVTPSVRVAIVCSSTPERREINIGHAV